MAERGRRAQAEGRATRVPSALREREHQYRAIFEATSDGLVINDAETGIVLEANPAFCRMHGYTQMVGLHPSSFIHPDSHQLFEQYIQTVRQGGEFRTQAKDVRRDGTVFDVEVLGRGFTYRGRPALLGVVRDITEQLSQARLREVAALAAENARLREDAERRARTNEALYQADEQLYRSLELDQVLQALVDAAMAILGPDTAGVWTVDAQRGALVALAVRGALPGFIKALDAVTALDVPIVRDSLTTEIMVVEDLETDERLTPAVRDLLRAEGIRAALTTPIQVGDQMFGVFSLGFRSARVFSADEQRLLRALGRRASMAITNARLYEQAQQVATLEERQRLARELHDAVTQTLFSSALIAEVVPDLWEVNPAEGRFRLQQLRRLTRGALAEMRSLLIELRPGALTELPLGELLKQLAEATAGRTTLEIDVLVVGRAPATLAGDVQVAVYRVAQESLNNVARHAQARTVRLCLRYVPTGLSLRIEDDGRGFDPAAVPAGHLGVRIMRERAQGIGARLRIESAPGRGMRVAITWRGARSQPAPTA